MNIRTRLSGLLAWLAILGILAGLPAILFAVGANPFSGTVWSVDGLLRALTTRDDGTLAIAAFKLVGWIAWAILTSSIMIELVAKARGIRVPHLPGLRVPQLIAQVLVATAVLTFVAPTMAHATPPTIPAHTTQATITQQAVPTTTATTPAASPKTADTPATTTIKHTVKRGETLWSIAQHYLGDGTRYKEIAAQNTHLLGGRPGFLRPGWVLDIPVPTTAAPTAPTVAVPGTYTVVRGDTLSSIAQAQLGDASRWPEIFEASKSIPQPGGRTLSNPSMIGIGWTLHLPTTTQAAQATTTVAPAAPVAAPSIPAPTEPAISAPTTTAPTEATAPAQAAEPAGQITNTAAADDAPTIQPATIDEAGTDNAWIARTGYGVSALLAAGLVGLLTRRRKLQQRRRRLGQRLPLPTPAATQIEQELRATADAISVDAVDQALRHLAHNCTQTGTPLPAVRAARLTATQFDLYLASATPSPLPAPWTATEDSTVWTLNATDAALTADLDPATVPAPYPSLVTIGQDDEQGHVLLNLEQLGALGIVGAEHDTREVLAALALELALSSWADDLQVTLVGAFPDLEDVMQTGRIRYLPTLGRVLDELGRRADRDRTALDAAHTDLDTARVTSTAPDSWQPEIVLIASALTDQQRTQLEDLVLATPRVALATVTHGVAVGQWGLDLTSTDTPTKALLHPIGLQLDPQRLPAAQYGQLLEIVALTDVDELEGETGGELSLADVDTVTDTEDQPGFAPDLEQDTPVTDVVEQPAAQPLVVDEAAAIESPLIADTVAEAPHVEAPQLAPAEIAAIRPPRILMLGPVDLQDAGGNVEPSKRARLLEYATYLALHPNATFSAIDDAIWPDRKTEANLNTRNTATSKLRRWFGTDPDGQDYLPRSEAGAGYAFLPTVATDVDDWNQLVHGDPVNAATENLEKALKLVRGTPFEGAHPKRYAWADPHRQRLISEIVDASYELAKRRLMAGKWRAAEQAVVVGLRIEPGQEMLWRLRILAAHESRNPAAETEAIDRLLTITEQLECDLEPETEQLLADLKNHGSGRDLLIAL